MSWSGTVYCGHCGQRGHNRLGCPERKRYAKENPTSYVANQLKREAETRAEAIASRTCSYCSESGHNRRGCKTLKEDRVLIQAAQEQYCKDFLSELEDLGLGMGALVHVPTGHAGDEHSAWTTSVLVMVTDINWKDIDFLLKTGGNRAYSSARAVMTGRVVKSCGYNSPTTDGWRRDPVHNDSWRFNEFSLPLESLQASSVSPSFTRGVVVSPSNVVSWSLPSGLPRRVEQEFNLAPDKRADRWQNERLSLQSASWSVVRKEEHEKARDPAGHRDG